MEEAALDVTAAVVEPMSCDTADRRDTSLFDDGNWRAAAMAGVNNTIKAVFILASCVATIGG